MLVFYRPVIRIDDPFNNCGSIRRRTATIHPFTTVQTLARVFVMKFPVYDGWQGAAGVR
jgi:hypothetical protein